MRFLPFVGALLLAACSGGSADPGMQTIGFGSPLEVGHYRVTVEITPSSVPPLTGEFDVTRS